MQEKKSKRFVSKRQRELDKSRWSHAQNYQISDYSLGHNYISEKTNLVIVTIGLPKTVADMYASFHGKQSRLEKLIVELLSEA